MSIYSRIVKRLPYFKNHINFKNTILVYQMGKVGSSSIEIAIDQQTNYRVIKLHRVNPKNIRKVQTRHQKEGIRSQQNTLGLKIYKNIYHSKKIIRIISPIRNPVDRNVSAYFQNISNYFPNIDFDNPPPIKKILKVFLERYPHDTAINWYQNEVIPVTNIDIFKHDFDKKKGYQYLKKENIRLLIYKSKITDENKIKIINKFLETNIKTIPKTNISSQKNYARLYQKFKNTVKLPKSYINKLSKSKYSKHFFTNGEINNWYKKWT